MNNINNGVFDVCFDSRQHNTVHNNHSFDYLSISNMHNDIRFIQEYCSNTCASKLKA